MSHEPSDAGTTDPELVRSVLAGEAEAEEAFVRRYRNLILGLARSRFGLDGSAAEDLLQTTLATLWHDDLRVLRAWRGQGRFSTYLSVIVCRLCRQRLAAEQRRQAVEQPTSAWGQLVSPEPAPEAATLDQERLAAVRRALDGLAPRDRLVIAWRFFDERSPRDFAAELGVSTGAARKALHDALRRLRQRLVAQEAATPDSQDPAGAPR